MEKIEIEKNLFKDMEYNSKNIREGDIFVALEGATVDGHNFIEDAIKNGAKGIIHSKNIEKKEGIKYYKIENLREKLGEIASDFYGYPQNDIKIIGVTGTNGKTTMTYLIEEILGSENVARIGTVEYKIGDEIIEAPNTTPESLDIVKFCKKIQDKKIKYLVMEVSSHALMLGRVNMLKFDIVVFSNLTPEHLDFHKNMEDYYLAKRELFLKLKSSGSAVINLDDSYGKRYHMDFKGLGYGMKNGELKGEFIKGKNDEIQVEYNGEKREVRIKLLGEYNLYNILGAIGVGLKLGYNLEFLMDKVTKMKGAPGRFEIIDCGQNFTGIVDYAHSPDALENILKTAEKIGFRRIITVFGCGGDRDKSKRSVMTKIALNHSDKVIVTSDNPRTEDINDIIKEMTIDFKDEIGKKIIIESDRELGILKGVEIAQDGDVLIIAGKGHETYQIIGKKKYHFDDREILRREIIRRKKKEN